jgi:hypothetical protein
MATFDSIDEALGELKATLEVHVEAARSLLGEAEVAVRLRYDKKANLDRIEALRARTQRLMRAVVALRSKSSQFADLVTSQRADDWQVHAVLELLHRHAEKTRLPR